MKKILLLIAGLLPVVAMASSDVQLDKHMTDLRDTASLQRGAQTYMNYCMGCHSLEHGRYNRVAKDLGIPEDLMMENLVFADKKFGDLMTNAMRPADGAKWFGATPPDLTLVARVRGSDWIYTYLRSFYEDDSRPYGVNNTVFKDVGMPHVLAGLQGRQVLGEAAVKTGYDTLTGQEVTEVQDDVLYLAESGKLSVAEYDEVVSDLVNFLTYMGEPIALERQSLGWKVLIFLLILLVPVYFLNKEFWKDVK